MTRLYAVPDDFEAIIRILTKTEGGRETSPFNGIRWDFSYVSDDPAKHRYMIWPDFFGPDGASLPKDFPLPLGKDLPARMTVVVDESREHIHRARIKVGVEFHCHEGLMKVAVGRVTRITGLNSPRRPLSTA